MYFGVLRIDDATAPVQAEALACFDMTCLRGAAAAKAHLAGAGTPA
jgi:hypothetical protein